MRKRNLIATGVLMCAALLMVAPAAQPAAAAAERRRGHQARQLHRSVRLEGEGQAGRRRAGAGVRGRSERERAALERPHQPERLADLPGARTTHAPSGSFEIERHPNDQAGTDRFVARATNVSTGETCVGRSRSSAPRPPRSSFRNSVRDGLEFLGLFRIRVRIVQSVEGVVCGDVQGRGRGAGTPRGGAPLRLRPAGAVPLPQHGVLGGGRRASVYQALRRMEREGWSAVAHRRVRRRPDVASFASPGRAANG